VPHIRALLDGKMLICDCRLEWQTQQQRNRSLGRIIALLELEQMNKSYYITIRQMMAPMTRKSKSKK